MQTDMQLRIVAAIASILAGWLAQHLGIDSQSANIVSTAVISGGIGWATKFYTDWNTKTVPVNAVVIPTRVLVPDGHTAVPNDTLTLLQKELTKT